MANCHDLFQKFHDEIKLPKSKRDFLKSSRNALRDKIRKYFKETIKKEIPKFHCQGSYAISTIINPLDGEYDIDDGIYLQNLDPDKSNWPTPETVHSWICNAAKNHTDKVPIDKRTCVRVIYSGQYHVDLPIYGIYNNKPYLAEKGDMGWHVSDSRAITNWFKSEVANKGDQLRRIVKYLKAWADNKSYGGKLPSGLILTILVVNNYANSVRDDVSFTRTIEKIYNQLLIPSVIINPVDYNENLSERITDTQMRNFKEKLFLLQDNANFALRESDEEKACKTWKEEFGDRFPSSDLNDKKRMAEEIHKAIEKDDIYAVKGSSILIIGKNKYDSNVSRVPSSPSWRP